ncbi:MULTISPECIES: S8 family serine peptidase [unclassified Colwellia]|uniref:S8 family serine peptidase n=1 Tax=unclassified Colwellia TaxID=196834 RepID=UPI0015F407B6|nr:MULTISPECIES: S8 family serine peptidase [unclassified Colwellia]MBA6231771.1 S8 family serine peptidase [Colwellia sp. MB02u-7]MBA6235726.1 S8 family serine peptidase [Colwellia sp. MB02u-11]MBA6254797.1 S8 family serine peptidase [Colwellia sp. MB3u-28]MBA6259278.1 S8 family serine peptidase [Colwellia sp. MB3u-41]MBA6298815.1 S8 family serine peptidase [Colwellia sp. MB3u-22]
MKTKLSALTLALLPLFANASLDLSSKEGLTYKSDSIIVVYRDSASKFDRRAARSIVRAKISDLNNDEIDDKYRNLKEGRIAKFTLDNISVKSALEKLRKNPAVLYAEPDYIVHASVIPDDSSFADLWGMNNTGQSGGVADADIDAPEAWDISTGSHDVIVGVIDTGVDHTHPDLTANIWSNPGEIAGDGIDNDGNGYIDDIHGINAISGVGDPMDTGGHGSHVSGTIGASGNNGLGVVGVNHDVSIIGCKFLGDQGGTTSDAIACIDYFVGLKNNGVNVRVTNNSWGGGGFSQALSDAITSSEEANILFVAAAGNDAYDNDAQSSYPSGYPHDSVLAVASTTRTDSMSSFSQWGLTTVDLGAPGSDILSTIPGGGYASYSGTSMATPHVTGAAALAWSVNPELSAIEMKALLMSSGEDNAALAGKTVSGKRLNVNNALNDANPTPGFTLAATPGSNTIEAGATATYSFNVGSVADWDGEVSLTLDGSLAGATLSTDTATPGATFELSVPTTAETQWGEYTFVVTGTSDDLVKASTVRLMVNPQGLNEFTYTNDEVVSIPDNNAEGISSTINVADELTVFASDIYVNITHTWIGDLTVMLTSPSGTTAPLHSASGGGDDNIDSTFSSSAFNGEVATGDWILSVADNAAADTGTLNNWALTITGIGETLPSAPQASFTYEADGLTATFTDSSSDRNDDMVSWDWNFGDGAISSAQNPVHSFAATGNYEVTLTVTDSEGLNSTENMLVSVSSVSIEAAVKRAYKSRLGRLRVDITWEGTSADRVDIFRNGVKIDTVENTGIYRDRERRATGNQFVYQICDASTACSNEVTVNF